MNPKLENKDILNHGMIGNWAPSEEPQMGTITWSNPDYDFDICATPHWLEYGKVPVGIHFDDGEYLDTETFDVDTNTSIEEQLKEYVSKMTLIFSRR